MKLPKSINILGQDLEVIEGPLNHMYGCYDYIQKCIFIDTEVHKKWNEDIQATFIHEMIHAISKRVGLSQSIDRDIEEIICESIANCITDNFTLVPKDKPNVKHKVRHKIKSK